MSSSMPVFRHAESQLMQATVQWVPGPDDARLPAVYVQESSQSAYVVQGLTLKVNQIVAVEFIGPADGAAKTLRISAIVSDPPTGADATSSDPTTPSS